MIENGKLDKDFDRVDHIVFFSRQC